MTNNIKNSPRLWSHELPSASREENKYDHGHAVVMGGEKQCTGAAKLAAYAALRAGSGLVSIACSEEALAVYAPALTTVMTKPYKNKKELKALLEDRRINAVLAGPGNGVSAKTKDNVKLILEQKKLTVLDADAITVFEDNPKELFSYITSPVVLTPHEGEFKRIFPQLEGDKIERAVQAANLSNCVVLLKGADTVIASPDGKYIINKNAPPCLATAGTGDVLSGIILGLIANDMDVFHATCAATWIHAKIAEKIGTGMIAEDMQNHIPVIMQGLLTNSLI